MNDDGMGRRDAARRVLAAFGAAVFAPLALTGCGEEDEADAVRPQQDEEATPPAAPASPVATGSGPQAGWVSVWVGEFTEELDLDGYLGEPFDRDHGLEPTDQGEYVVRPSPLPLAELLDGCFLSDRWAPPLVEEARRRGVTEASCAVVRLHYRHTEQTPPNSPLRFVASIQWG